ncbi:MAG: type II toxin-antitoxin system prevent-host-death family antitoxin [Candidatus Dependentiae bacterium]|jgi:prevent-host-death family protein
MKKWPLNRARVRLNEVIQLAAHEGAQTITVKGKDAAVILSPEEYACLLDNQRQQPGKLPKEDQNLSSS